MPYYATSCAGSITPAPVVETLVQLDPPLPVIETSFQELPPVVVSSTTVQVKTESGLTSSSSNTPVGITVYVISKFTLFTAKFIALPATFTTISGTGITQAVFTIH